MRTLKGKEDTESKKELAKCIESIASLADKNYQKVKDELAKIKLSEGRLDNKQVWKLKKTLCPNNIDVPCAMNDDKGNLITSNKSVKQHALMSYLSKKQQEQTF